MSNRYIHFLVAPTGSSPEALLKSIKEVNSSSISFCASWSSGYKNDARTISENAFKFLDHIQNELIRHRDKKINDSNYNNSALKTALEKNVGSLIDPVNPNCKTEFMSLSIGSGAMPAEATLKNLSLSSALNKLKHHAVGQVNFTVDLQGKHILFFFTNGGQEYNDTISCFNVQKFCEACKEAVEAINT